MCLVASETEEACSQVTDDDSDEEGTLDRSQLNSMARVDVSEFNCCAVAF